MLQKVGEIEIVQGKRINKSLFPTFAHCVVIIIILFTKSTYGVGTKLSKIIFSLLSWSLHS